MVAATNAITEIIVSLPFLRLDASANAKQLIAVHTPGAGSQWERQLTPIEITPALNSAASHKHIRSDIALKFKFNNCIQTTKLKTHWCCGLTKLTAFSQLLRSLHLTLNGTIKPFGHFDARHLSTRPQFMLTATATHKPIASVKFLSC